MLMIFSFIAGYSFITIEHYTKINKATIALLMAVVCWTIQFSNTEWLAEANNNFLAEHLADISQTVFFLIGALTVVETINQHKGFNAISKYVNFCSKKKMLWVITFITFFLSGILDNLTTTVVMISLLRKLVDEGEDRWLIGGAIVIAANAGGAWTPIGDLTTTMLWIGGQISTLNIMKVLIFPSLFCTIVSTFCLSLSLKGNFEQKNLSDNVEGKEPLGAFILGLGVALLVFVPIFKVLTGLPPFMGMLLALSILWLVTDLYHYKHEGREHLRIPNILTKIDFSGVLFFLGILLCIASLYSAGLLTQLANWLQTYIGNLPIISVIIGFASAVIDNVPLVAATIGMYSLEQFPTDHNFWNMIAYCAGIGGSILIIGSAAGIAFMALEKVDFLWYVKRISLPATIGYLAGFFLYLLAI
ncbi:MAG: sodium:proton antiporter NhaD [Parachlamydiaceae bacterium]|nr:sodium:proton antiporter NhaD [Parachlamydiaceae bacterium]